METTSHSMEAVVERHICAEVGRVFEACCPVREYEWIPGSKCRLVHCPNERVEQGTVFVETLSAPFLQRAARGETTWTAILHDRETHRVHFELTNPRSRSCYEIEANQDAPGKTLLRLHLRYTARDAEGNRIIADRGAARLTAMMELLADLLAHYAETGQMLGLAALAGRLLRSSRLRPSDCCVSRRLAEAVSPKMSMRGTGWGRNGTPSRVSEGSSKTGSGKGNRQLFNLPARMGSLVES